MILPTHPASPVLPTPHAQRLLEGAASMLPDIIYLFDVIEQRHLYSNREIATILGYSSEEIQQEGAATLLRQVHPDDMPGVVRHMEAARLAKDGKLLEVEYRVRGKDGTFVWLAVRERVFERSADGAVRILIGVCQDVTEERTREASLRLSEAEFRAFFETAGVGAAQVGPDKRFVRVNERLCEMVGYSRDELLGTLPFDLDHPDDRAWDQERLGRAFREPGHLYDVEKRFVRKDGGVIWVRVNVEVLRNEAGEPVRTVAIIQDITARKRAELELRESYALLRNIIDSTPDLIFVKDCALRTLVCNESFARALDKRPDDLVGKTDIENGWDPELVRGNVEKGLRGYEQDDLEALAGRPVRIYGEPDRRGDGRRYFDTVKLPLHAANGEIIGVLGVSRDMTDQHQAAARLRESEARHRALFESNLDAVVVSPAPGRLDAANQAACRLFRMSEAEICRAGRDGIVAPDEAQLPAVIAEHARAGQYRGTLTFVRGDGTRFVGETSSVRHGVRGESFVIIRDVTELLRMSQELSASEARLRRAQDAARLGSWELDLRTGEMVWSDAMYELVGVSREAWQPTLERCLAAVHPDDAEMFRGVWQRLAAEGGRTSFECRLAHHAGHNVPVLAVLEAQRGEGGAVTAMLGLFQDITERRQLEEQFRQAQKMESVGRLAGGIAHDFNNLLTVILGSAEFGQRLLASSSGTPELHDALEEVIQASKRAAELTRSLLAFSRRQVVAPRVLAVHVVLTGMERMLRRLIGENIALRITAAASEPCRVRIDPGQLEQVVTNLIVNSRDAMPGGGSIKVEIDVTHLDATYCASRPELRPGDYVLITVSDTGCGMPAKVQAHLFEPFFTTKPVGTGTGLGLSTCYGIVTQNGGHIAVFSEPGHGTTIKVYLPAVAADVPGASVDASPSPTMARGSELVIVVEDEGGLLRLAVRILEGCGYRVLSAANAEDALALQGIPDSEDTLLITDIVLPGMDGRALSRSMLASHPRMRVLFISGHAENVIVHQGNLEEGISFLDKPFSAAGLARKVREVLDRRT